MYEKLDKENGQNKKTITENREEIQSLEEKIKGEGLDNDGKALKLKKDYLTEQEKTIQL